MATASHFLLVCPSESGDVTGTVTQAAAAGLAFCDRIWRSAEGIWREWLRPTHPRMHPAHAGTTVQSPSVSRREPDLPPSGSMGPHAHPNPPSPMLGCALATVLGARRRSGPGPGQHALDSPTITSPVGDSYSVGYQPGKCDRRPDGDVAGKTHLKLVNFGCGGATTTSILQTVGCPDVLPHTAGVKTYPTTTQIAAAHAFIAANRGDIGLITVVDRRQRRDGPPDGGQPMTCVATAVKSIDTNVTTLAADLRSAAGPNVRIIGTTYPDVILGSYVYPTIRHPRRRSPWPSPRWSPSRR